MTRGRRTHTLLLLALAAAVLSSSPGRAQDVFGNPQTFSGGVATTDRVLASGDVDGDGDTDVAWLLGSSLRYLLGDGTGSFAPPRSTPSGLPALGPELVAGDLNADGRLDVVVGPGPGQTIGLLALGAPAGFEPRQVPLPRATGTWPVLADADGDGDDDVYLVGLGLTILSNDGSANLALVEDFDGTVAQERASFAVGDLDGDGRADLVAPALDGDHPGLDIVWVGARPVTGLPGVTAITVQPSLLEPGWVTRLADLEGDGDVDIVLHGRSTVTAGAVVQVIRNEGGRRFSALPAVSSLDRTGALDVDALLVDLDRDGLQDVVLGCASAGCRMLVVHHGAGLGAVGSAQYLPVLGPSRRLLAVDVDCDGDDDVVGGSADGLTVVLNRGGRVYEDQVYTFIAGEDLVATSVNGDAAPDLAGIDSTGVEIAFGRGCGVGDVRACTLPVPMANAGPDLVGCGQPGESQSLVLSGIGSSGGRPIARYCWSTSNGTFAESGVAVHCAAALTATLQLPTVAGRTEAEVTLTVTDFQGCSDDDQVVVATESEPVVQEARVSASRVCQGEVVSFVARAADIFSTVLTYGWDFDITEDTNGDGVPGNDVDGSVQAVSGALGVVSHAYSTRGTRTARLLVMGEGECFATADVQVDVVSAPRITSVGGPAFTCPDRAGSFSVNQTGGTPPLLYTWDFDTSVDADGNGDPADDSQSVERNPTWSYATSGEKTVRVTVVGAGGCSDTREIPVTVSDRPEADFQVATPVCGTTVVSFRDQSVGRPPLTATWDFGDGSAAVSGLNATHVFPGPGTYAVTETVRDGNGCTARATRFVTIADVALDLTSTRLFDGQPGTDSQGNANGFGEPGETVQLAFTATNRGADTATGVTAEVDVVSPLSGVTVLDGVADFPTIDGGQSGASLSPHVRLRLDETLPCGSTVVIDVRLAGFGSDACADTERITLTVGLPALTLFGAEGPVTQSDGRSVGPAADYGEDHHVTVFTDDASGVAQVHFVRHLFDGPRVLPAVLLSASPFGATAPRLAWSPSLRQFGVAWRRFLDERETRVAFARVSKTGDILGGIVEVGDGRVGEPDVAWTGDEWVVAWPEGPDHANKAVKARAVGPTGQPVSATWLLADDSTDHEHVRLVAGGPTWQAAWTSTSEAGATSLVIETFLAGTPDVLAPIGRRVVAGVREEPPGSAAMAGRFFQAWSTPADVVVVASFDSGGTLLTEQPAGNGGRPDLAAGPDFGVLAFDQNDEVFARGVAQTGAVFSNVVPVSGGVGTSNRPTVSASPQGLFMVLWQDTRRLQETNHEIYGAVLAPVGDPGCTIAGLGDVVPAPNGDGVVSVADVVFLLRVAVGLEPITPTILARGDVAPGLRQGDLHRVIGDGAINVGDVVVLLDVAVGNVRLTPY
jgi:PKD repeat protein